MKHRSRPAPVSSRILDASKLGFYKKVMCLHRGARNRLVSLFSQAPLLCEDLVKGGFSSSSALENYFADWEDKLAVIDECFLKTPAFISSEWKNSGYRKRHIVCRASVHGFHHIICSNEQSHDRDVSCICKFCQGGCNDINHAVGCSEIPNLSWLDAQALKQ